MNLGTLFGIGLLLYWFSQRTRSVSPDGSIPPDRVPISVPPDLQSGVQQQIVGGNQEAGVVAGAGGTAATIGAGVATTSATGAFLGLSATAWTVVGAAIVGITALVLALRSHTHLFANQLVQQYENPFGTYVITLIRNETSLLNSGQLTCSDAQAMHQALADAWQHYQDSMHMLMSQSTDWLIVAKQSLNNLDNQFEGETLPNGNMLTQGMGGQYPNGFMTSWLNWQQQLISNVC